jgi:hypothetical protein
MKTENELFSAIGRTGRVIPTFAVLSIVGCTLAHFVFGVSAEYLGVVVAVPLSWLFLFSRVLRITITPTEAHHEHRKIPRLFVFFGLGALFSGLLAIDLLLSAPVYIRLALPRRIVIGTLDIAAVCGLAALASLIAMILSVMPNVMARFSVALKAGIWRILSYPTVLADNIFPQFHHKKL